MANGIKIEEIIVGVGIKAERGQVVSVYWKGTLNRGDLFGEGERTFLAGSREVIAGLSLGVIGMCVGGRRRLRVSPHLGFRDQVVPGVPANAVLVIEVELFGVRII